MPRAKGHGKYRAKQEYRRSNVAATVLLKVHNRLDSRGAKSAADEVWEMYLEEFAAGREAFDQAYLREANL